MLTGFDMDLLRWTHIFSASFLSSHLPRCASWRQYGEVVSAKGGLSMDLTIQRVIFLAPSSSIPTTPPRTPSPPPWASTTRLSHGHPIGTFAQGHVSGPQCGRRLHWIWSWGKPSLEGSGEVGGLIAGRVLLTCGFCLSC